MGNRWVSHWLEESRCGCTSTTRGPLIHQNPEVDPIVPVGRVIRELGCSRKWEEDECIVVHPVRGVIPVELCNGCPEISRHSGTCTHQRP